MKRALTFLLVLSVALLAFRCDKGGTNRPDFKILGDLLDDGPNLPEVPPYVFELVVQDVADGVGEDQAPADPDAEVLSSGDVDAETPVGEDVKQDDGACKPQCVFEDDTPKECGPDGCGSICGYCDYEHICVEGVCEVYCPPDCDGKECGFDGCYGECPPGCDEGFICGEDQLCYPFCDHDENCKDKDCGPDGCGGSCGDCGLGKLCDDDNGVCIPDPCGTVDKEKGQCSDDNVLLQCIDGQLVETSCPSLGNDFYCKWDGPLQEFVCAEGCVPICIFPDGTPKECGYDGCYGVCGNCAEGWSCDAGACYPEAGASCGWIPESGICIDNKLWFCTNNILYLNDCPSNGMNCVFDTSNGKYKCE